MEARAPKVAIFLHNGAFDRLHQGLSVAATASAAGRPVDLFFFWWALERLASGQLDRLDLGPAGEAVAERFEEGRFPMPSALLKAARESGTCTVYGCTGSLAIMGLCPEALEGKVDQLVGWSTILDLSFGVSDRFYL